MTLPDRIAEIAARHLRGWRASDGVSGLDAVMLAACREAAEYERTECVKVARRVLDGSDEAIASKLEHESALREIDRLKAQAEEAAGEWRLMIADRDQLLKERDSLRELLRCWSCGTEVDVTVCRVCGELLPGLPGQDEVCGCPHGYKKGACGACGG